MKVHLKMENDQAMELLLKKINIAFTMVNGMKIIAMDMGNNNGKITLDLMVIGIMDDLKMEHMFFQMVLNM